MQVKTDNKDYTIDASGKSLGRVSSDAAAALMGKRSPGFLRHIPAGVTVRITNAAKANISVKKLAGKIYTRYSGYPGGLKTERMEQVIAKKGYKEVFRRAVYGMLPGNKLRAGRMKHLIVTE
ncbi:MAG: 50S ribosomal protein L13 [Candidatus Lloydbacteria bacterium CG22_combo_CG10-13_8_21_14_all_47_15]|uniref:50S ribosomal protein L13 n=1 Tax=Candidatus Lloydbacteria bacterium CG22_combo_CG10-13_8_21_14_all_47_15 TaxID=1974635 RepID=A0A2H0CTN6_9BACT|nr:MAG: 50S ribosomal protein L13 [Candidatus Lloydbacteria bacterium CG22_combo_CG10-13_8_21_14_all_47_15]